MGLLISIILNVFLFADSNELTFVSADTTYVKAEMSKLKDSVLNTRLQIRMFQEILESEGINQSYPKVNISFSNTLGARYRIYSVEYIVDGVKSFYYQLPEEALRNVSSVQEKIQDFETTLAPGPHNIQAIVSYVGNDKGIFSYLSEYKVQMSEKQDLKLVKNNNYKIKIQAYEQGGLLADFKEKAKLKIAFSEIAK